MSEPLDILCEVAFSMESESVSDWPLASCRQPGQGCFELEPYDTLGKWYYWLVAKDKDGNEMFIRDKYGWCIWSPFWAYSSKEAIHESLIQAIYLHRRKEIEFSELTVVELRFEEHFYYATLIKEQWRRIERLERDTARERPNIDLFLKYISERKRLLREKHRALLDQ